MIHIKPLSSPLIHFVSPSDLFGEPECVMSILNKLTGEGMSLYGVPFLLKPAWAWATLMSTRHCMTLGFNADIGSFCLSLIFQSDLSVVGGM